MHRPEPTRGLVIAVEYEVEYDLLLSACEELAARGEEADREAVLVEAESLLREVGAQWPSLTGAEDYTVGAKQAVQLLFREELLSGMIKNWR